MRHLFNRGTAAAAVAALLLSPSPVAAQDTTSVPMPLVEVSAGYTFMRDFSSDLPEDVNFPAGWYAAGAVNLNHWFDIVGELTGSYKNSFEVSIDTITFSNDARVYTFMGGPRFSAKAGRVVPYAQLLVGGAHMRVKMFMPDEFAELELGGSASANTTDFAFQPGAGVTFLVTEHLGLRAAADYRRIIDFADGENNYADEFRFLTGFTLGWGAR